MKSLRDVFRRLPPDGIVRNELRQFNLAPKAGGQVPSVKALAERLGFAVERVMLPIGMAGRLVADPFAYNGYRIEVNAAESVVRQRWTVLHEIGHYYFHSDHHDFFAPEKLRERGDPFYLEHELIEEREADQFAEVVFYGDGALTAARSLFGDDVEKLSKHFGTSPQSVRIAMKRL
jgi:hypothetical protein